MILCFFVPDDDPDFQRRINIPGAMWFCPWYFDPEKDQIESLHPMFSVFYKATLLTDPRPPIAVCCPDGRPWLIDQRSSNGEGWVVTGTVPNITVSPSIVVPEYHGFLQNGRFTKDIEGRQYAMSGL